MATKNYSGELSGTDYGDKCEISATATTYKYKFKVGGEGKCTLKIKKYNPPLIGDVGSDGSWSTLVKEKTIEAGKEITGEFNPGYVKLSSEVKSPYSTLKIIFKRPFLGKKVTYTLTLKYVSATVSDS